MRDTPRDFHVTTPSLLQHLPINNPNISKMKKSNNKTLLRNRPITRRKRGRGNNRYEKNLDGCQNVGDIYHPAPSSSP